MFYEMFLDFELAHLSLLLDLGEHRHAFTAGCPYGDTIGCTSEKLIVCS